MHERMMHGEAMSNLDLSWPTLAAALGTGLVAGMFYAFSSFVMPALGRLPAPHAVAAMQSINVTVITPSFLVIFLGSAVVAGALGVHAVIYWDRPGAALRLAGAVLYLVGTIGVTRFGNIPMNNAIAALDPSSPEAAAYWAKFLSSWVTWNTVRTAAALAAAGAFVWSLRTAAAA
jgi:uncharacterized membrane protein